MWSASGSKGRRLGRAGAGVWPAGARWHECDLPAFSGAGEEVVFQGDEAEDAAPHAGENGQGVVGAEDGGQRGEARARGLGGGCFSEAAAVAEENPDEVEEGGEAFRHGLAGPVPGGIGLGRPGDGWRLGVHVCGANGNVRGCQGRGAAI